MASDPPQRFQERMYREREQLIAQEMARLLGERGCFGVNVDDVARNSGVAKGTVYLHFDDKRALVNGALDEACRVLIGMIDARLIGVEDSRQRLREAIHVLVESVLERPELTALLERLPCATVWSGGDRAAYDRLVRRFAELLVATGRLGDIDPAFVAQAMLAVASTPAWHAVASQDSPAAVELLGCLASAWA